MANIPHGYRIERDKAVVELTQAEQALRKCPEITAVRKPYTAAYRFQLVMAEEAFHPGMNRYDVIEPLYCLLEPSENGRKSASDVEKGMDQKQAGKLCSTGGQKRVRFISGANP